MPAIQPSILIIDHDQDCRDTLRKKLHADEYVVAEADTGERALAMLRAETFDFIFLDARMSDVSSATLVQKIRADVRVQETPIIVTGMRRDESRVDECMRNGADERLSKPYGIAAVKALIWKLHPRLSNDNSSNTPPPNSERGTILVVDDNELNLDLISRRLKGAGYRVICASNGAQSLRLLNSANYDLVLLDIMMPELSGIDVLKVIRSNPRTKRVSVIMVSALDDTKNIEECIQLGADDYVTKPYNPRALTSCIESQIRERRQHDDFHFRQTSAHDDK